MDRQWCAPISVPVLVIGGRQDTMVSFQDSLSLGEILPNAQVRIMDDWGHYTLFSDTQESVSKVMLGFLQTLEAFDCRTVPPAFLTPFVRRQLYRPPVDRVRQTWIDGRWRRQTAR